MRFALFARPIPFASLVVCASLGAVASKPLAAVDVAPAVFHMPPPAVGCPLGFSVSRSAKSGLVDVDTPGTPFMQGLELRFHAIGTPLRAVTVLVHGYAGGPGFVPAASPKASVGSSGNETESFDLSAAAGHELRVSSVHTQRLGAVSWLELTRIEYANGDTWKPAEGARCTAAPSVFVLVGAGD